MAERDHKTQGHEGGLPQKKLKIIISIYEDNYK